MSRSGAGLQRVLVALQIAFALALVTGAMLLARSFAALQSTDVGFAVDQVFTFRVAPGPGSGSAEPDLPQLDERLRSLPGVIAVGRATHAPLEGDVPRMSYQLGALAGQSESWTAAIRHVNAGYYAALEIPILEGRGFGSPPDGIVISRRLASRHWPDRSPVGEVLRVDGEPNVIVGVSGDTLEWGPHADAPPLIYKHHTGGDTWILRQAPGSSPVTTAIRSIVAEVQPRAAVYHALSMREGLRRNTARSELMSTTMMVFAAVALLLAAMGVHASLGHATARRAREFAIRSALGASPAAVARLVLRQGVGLAAAGMFFGGCLALGTGRVLQAFLPNISQHDSAALLGAIAAISAAILLACAAAMRRAAKTEPLGALREGRAQ